MGALPAQLYTAQCSKSTKSARASMNAMIDDFSKNQDIKGMGDMNKMLSYTDDIAINCYKGIQ